MAKQHKKTGKMPPHNFIALVDFTYDRFYRKGETVVLSHEKTAQNLLNKKIIKYYGSTK